MYGEREAERHRHRDSPRAFQGSKLCLLVGNAAQVPHLVPMARGKHLFPSRTQQLSPVAVTILGF
jgi:hypothetical protein